MDYATWPEWVKALVTSLGGGIGGIATGWAIEWYKKKKKPRLEDIEVAAQLTTSAKDNVATAKENVATSQALVDLLEGRLTKEREYYEGLIERSKKECENQITDMKNIYDRIIEDLQAQIIKGKNENTELSRQVNNLTNDKNKLQQEVASLTMGKDAVQRELTDLKTKMKQYEKSGTGPLPPLAGE